MTTDLVDAPIDIIALTLAVIDTKEAEFERLLSEVRAERRDYTASALRTLGDLSSTRSGLLVEEADLPGLAEGAGNGAAANWEGSENVTNTYDATQENVVAFEAGEQYSSYDTKFLQKLVGKKIDKVGVSRSGGEFLILLFEDGTGQLLEGEGDCCSHTYFAEVLGAKGSYGGEVTAIRNLNVPDIDDENKNYGFAIDTDLGSIRVVYRNESNGYYGGWCKEITPENINLNTTFDFIETNDWSA